VVVAVAHPTAVAEGAAATLVVVATREAVVTLAEGTTKDRDQGD
jgi:hypothetical protein